MLASSSTNSTRGLVGCTPPNVAAPARALPRLNPRLPGAWAPPGRPSCHALLTNHHRRHRHDRRPRRPRRGRARLGRRHEYPAGRRRPGRGDRPAGQVAPSGAPSVRRTARALVRRRRHGRSGPGRRARARPRGAAIAGPTATATTWTTTTAATAGARDGDRPRGHGQRSGDHAATGRRRRRLRRSRRRRLQRPRRRATAAMTTTAPAPRKPSWVFGGALGAFVAVLALPPASRGPIPPAAEPRAPVPPRQIVVRRVITRVVGRTTRPRRSPRLPPAAVQSSAARARAPPRPLPLPPRAAPHHPVLMTPARARLPRHGHDGAAARRRARRSSRPARWIEALAARLTRFDPASELCALNADPRARCRRRRCCGAPSQAALLGARRTGGLADPTLLDAVEAAGYARSLHRPPPRRSTTRCAAAPPRRPATPGRALARGRGRREAGTIVRPPGLRLDLGGSAKGLAADSPSRARCRRAAAPSTAAATCASAARTTSTCRDTAPADRSPAAHRRRGRHVRHRPARVAAARRLLAHHLLDPAPASPPGPACSRATAIAADRALEAEALAKAALLAGPPGARASGRGRRDLSSATTAARAVVEPRPRGRMTRDRMDYGWWLASRASGLVALALIALVGRRRPRDGRRGVPEARAAAHA